MADSSLHPQAGDVAAPPVAPVSGTRARGRSLLYLSLGIASFILLADQITKFLVRISLATWESVPAEGVFRLTHVQNTGSAFGLFPSQTVILSILGVIAIAGLVFALRYHPMRNPWASVALGLLLGGSIGNLVDRIRLGYVTDFVDVGFPQGWRFYTFNVADSAITVGSILVGLVLLRMGGGPAQGKPAPEEKAGPSSQG
ncbi:MAG: signal peptidase II [Chloroflexi bacterium]|nr:signal peptidase II [Chloroflexota bacterium]